MANPYLSSFVQSVKLLQGPSHCGIPLTQLAYGSIVYHSCSYEVMQCEASVPTSGPSIIICYHSNYIHTQYLILLP